MDLYQRADEKLELLMTLGEGFITNQRHEHNTQLIYRCAYFNILQGGFVVHTVITKI